MSSYPERRDVYRRAAARRQQAPPPGGDAVTAALAAQVMICIALLLAMLALKHFNEPVYIQAKAQYQEMVAQSDGSGAFFSGFSGFDSLFAPLDDFLGGLSGNPPAAEESSVSDGSEFDEPEDPPEDPPSDTETNMDYNYLDTPEIAYTAAMGGAFPVGAENNGDLLPAPAGSVISPVYLGASIRPPVTGVITSGFSYRYHPVTDESDFHTGIDIAAEEGRAILAAMPGEVVEVGQSPVYGNYIVLKHSTNLKTSYSHCSEIIAEEGMAVRQGERIAKVGQTGVATGPHLHFSVIVENEFTDPEWILQDYIQLVE